MDSISSCSRQPVIDHNGSLICEAQLFEFGNFEVEAVELGSPCFGHWWSVFRFTFTVGVVAKARAIIFYRDRRKRRFQAFRWSQNQSAGPFNLIPFCTPAFALGFNWSFDGSGRARFRHDPRMAGLARFEIA